jgi:hypothetical protein
MGCKQSTNKKQQMQQNQQQVQNEKNQKNSQSQQQTQQQTRVNSKEVPIQKEASTKEIQSQQQSKTHQPSKKTEVNPSSFSKSKQEEKKYEEVFSKKEVESKIEQQSKKQSNQIYPTPTYLGFLDNISKNKESKYNQTEQSGKPNAFDSVAEVDDIGLEGMSVLGRSLCQNIISEYSKLNLIARPLTEPFELVILNIENKNLSINSSFDNPILNKYNSRAAYCNGHNKLFFSGGEMKHFVVIDLENFVVDTMPYEENRKSHSMISIPSQFEFSVTSFKMTIPSAYIFIVGGDGNKRVEYYDLKNKHIVHHSQTNEIHIEPALALLDNKFLYCFSGFKRPSGRRECFERINLKSKQEKWESFNVQTKSNSKFGQTCFAVAHYGENKLIFLGGYDSINSSLNSTDNFIFDWENNTLELSQQDPVTEEYNEKFFFPIREETIKNNYSSLAFPAFQRNNINISFFISRKLYSSHFQTES